MVIKKLALVALMLAGFLAWLKLTSLSFHLVMAGKWGTGHAVNTAGDILLIALPLIAHVLNQKLKAKE